MNGVFLMMEGLLIKISLRPTVLVKSHAIVLLALGKPCLYQNILVCKSKDRKYPIQNPLFQLNKITKNKSSG